MQDLQEQHKKLKAKEEEINQIHEQAKELMKRADEKSEAAAKVHGRAESVKAWERAFTQARQA